MMARPIPDWHSPEYRATLESNGWKRFSARVRSMGTCEACRKRFDPGSLQGHHWHYERLGLEGTVDSWDVSALCEECHPVADRHRKEIVKAAKAYARARGDENWRRAARLIGEVYVGLIRRPMMAEHVRVILAALPFLSPEP